MIWCKRTRDRAKIKDMRRVAIGDVTNQNQDEYVMTWKTSCGEMSKCEILTPVCMQPLVLFTQGVTVNE